MTWGELLDSRPDLATVWTAVVAFVSIVLTLAARNVLRVVVIIRKPGPLRIELGTDSGSSHPKSNPELPAIKGVNDAKGE